MAHSITFQMIPPESVRFSDDEPDATSEFTDSTVKMITVVGDPWVLFDTPNYGGDFIILTAGRKQFPSQIKGGTVQSMRVSKGGINSSQVTFYPLSFYKGPAVSFKNKQPELDEKFFSLQVVKGAVIFYDEKHYGGEKRILLNGDKVQNFTAVNPHWQVNEDCHGYEVEIKMTESIPLLCTQEECLQVHTCSREGIFTQGRLA